MIHCKYDELKNPKDLVDHPSNRNKHPKEQLERLAKIYEYQGIRHPIIVSKLSGFIVAGHGRKQAAIKAKIKEVPVVYQEFQNDEQEYAFIQSDNAIALWADLDLSGINSDLGNLGPDFDIDLLGIKNFTLDPETIEGECDEDEVGETPKEPRTKLGDIYELGNHRLMCGDSTSIDAVEKLMDGEKADMVYTDPPYGMNLDTDYRPMGSKNNFKKVIGDNEDFTAELIQTLLGVFSYCTEIFLFGADYYAELIKNRNEGSWVVWDKRSHGDDNIGTLDGSLGADFELCWSKSKHQRKMCRVIRNKGAFIKLREGVDTVHPTQKPVELALWFFDQWGKDKINLVDLFGGSGSTLIACEKTNRKCFMMELDSHYVDVIVSRYCKFTGKNLIKRNGKELDWSLDEEKE